MITECWCGKLIKTVTYKTKKEIENNIKVNLRETGFEDATAGGQICPRIVSRFVLYYHVEVSGFITRELLVKTFY
jgi:hypothetical protein